MTPTLLPLRTPDEDDPLIVNPPITYTPMINPTSFIVWNIGRRGGGGGQSYL
ncbi:hypothetical protein RDI58_015141 [Solanum bulbocastanum]|uniref:Uncharacterized protein n=1 Tax=Solanum bulbocastanum TaxID=147425 RepID=A0AAN8TJL5_SOLBU